MSDGGGEAGGGAGGRRGRAQRLPRWTRQEILVLIEGKRVVERTGRGGRGRGRGRVGVGGETAAEPTKWAAVAEYCRRHGVDRGPVQCRKRWSNLAGDYKKIREWERGCGAAAEPSFWAMRNDARKERRLPGFFDREVYDILEGRGGGGGSNNAAAAAVACKLDLEEDVEREKPGLASVAAGALFSSSSDEDDDDNDEAARPHPAVPAPALAPAPVSVPMLVSENTEVPRQESSQQGTSKRKEADEPTDENSPVQGRQKRQRSGDEGSGRATTDLQDQLIHILDRSGRMVAAQLEAQNINSQLDREQRKDQAGSLLGVLGKMADALYRIADKL